MVGEAHKIEELVFDGSVRIIIITLFVSGCTNNNDSCLTTDKGRIKYY